MAMISQVIETFLVGEEEKEEEEEDEEDEDDDDADVCADDM